MLPWLGIRRTGEPVGASDRRLRRCLWAVDTESDLEEGRERRCHSASHC